MTRFLGVVLGAAVVCGPCGPALAEDAGATAILDKAIKAQGGEQKLAAAKALSWKTKGTLSIMGNEAKISTQMTLQGIDHLRSEFSGDFGGMEIKAVAVLAGDKGWGKFGDMTNEMDKDRLAHEKRNLYLQVLPITLVPLKGNAYKLQAAGEEKVGGKPAVGLKVTPPDGKDFTLYFDKESGLLVRLVARVHDFMGTEFTQDSTFSDYKDFGGIKKATKIESKRDGEKFLDVEISDFKVLDKVDPKTFSEP
jgi:hypothetical protein